MQIKHIIKSRLTRSDIRRLPKKNAGISIVILKYSQSYNKNVCACPPVTLVALMYPHVAPQVRHKGHPLPALGADNRMATALSPVCMPLRNMSTQPVVLVKCGRALCACVLTDFVEATHVLFQVVHQGERVFALVARVEPLIGRVQLAVVHLAVPAKVGLSGEGFVTVLALKGPLSCKSKYKSKVPYWAKI